MLPRNNSKPITVDGVHYRYSISIPRPKMLPGGGHSNPPMRLIVVGPAGRMEFNLSTIRFPDGFEHSNSPRGTQRGHYSNHGNYGNREVEYIIKNYANKK